MLKRIYNSLLIFALIGLLAVMFYQQPILSLFTLIVGPLAILGVRMLLRKVREIADMELQSMGAIMKVIQETSSGIRIVKAFSLEKHMANRMDAAITKVEDRSTACARPATCAAAVLHAGRSWPAHRGQYNC